MNVIFKLQIFSTYDDIPIQSYRGRNDNLSIICIELNHICICWFMKLFLFKKTCDIFTVLTMKCLLMATAIIIIKNITKLSIISIHICFMYVITSFFKIYIFMDYAIRVVPFPPLHSTPSCPPPPSHIPPL